MNQRTRTQKSLSIAAVASLSTLPITIGGQTVQIASSSIKREAFEHHDGKTAAGNEVHSLYSQEIGETTVIRKGRKGPMNAYKTDDMEMLAIRVLQRRGYNIQAPNTGFPSIGQTIG